MAARPPSRPPARSKRKVLRTDAATLPADACLLYTGDFNLDGSTEAAYQTLTASGQGQGIDPLNNAPEDDTEVWDTAAYAPIATESSTALRYRDDIQFVSANVFNGTVLGRLQYLAGSYRTFGNNGTTAFGKSVNATTNTALANLQGPITAATALSALTTASDHLPVVADYTVSLSTPTAAVPVIESATNLAGQIGAALSYQITATNTPTGYTAAGLPDGVQLDPATGFIAGTPTATGTFAVTLGAVNAAGTGTATLTLTVASSALPVVLVAATVPETSAAGGAPGMFVLTRNGDVSSPLVVTLRFKGSAENGIDYFSHPLTKKDQGGQVIAKNHGRGDQPWRTARQRAGRQAGGAARGGIHGRHPGEGEGAHPLRRIIAGQAAAQAAGLTKVGMRVRGSP